MQEGTGGALEAVALLPVATRDLLRVVREAAVVACAAAVDVILTRLATQRRPCSCQSSQSRHVSLIVSVHGGPLYMYMCMFSER